MEGDNMKATTRIESGKAYYDSEEDVYTEGCIPNSGNGGVLDIQFKGDTVEDVIEQIKDYYGEDGMEINSCDEPGRVDIHRLETADGIEPSERQLQQWREGDFRLWLCSYTYYITQVTRQPIEIPVAVS
jgi:hypothetical protein